ncbi:MAG: sugar phosphate isomerase/epimerase [Chitinophagaceae bacterium]
MHTFKRLFATTIILSLFFAEPVFAQTGLYSFPYGVQAYTFRRSMPFTPEKTLDTIKMMGFTEIEGDPGKLTPQQFRKMCNDRGITIPSTGGTYEQLVNSPDSVVYLAKALGASFVMCAWIPHGATFTIENAKKAVDDFNKAGKYLKENGLTLCYHTHGYEFYPYEDGTLMDYIIKNTNPDYVSFEMDILWVQFGGGDPVSLLKKYGNRWKLMHLKDLRKGTQKNLSGGTSQDNDVVLGTGEIDIPNVLREAKRVGIKHYFIEDESNNVNGQVPASIRYLKNLK